MLENLNSQRKTRSFKSTNFLGTNQDRSNPREGREDLDRVMRTQVVAVEGGAEAELAAGVVEKGEEATLVVGLSRARTKLRGAITTGNGATTRRWRGEGHHLDDVTVHQYVIEQSR